MKARETRLLILKEFAPQLEQTTWQWKLWVGILLVLLGAAIYALVVQIVEGHIATGMRDNVIWGIYIANFIFLLGLSYGGAVIAAILHLLRVEWRKPIMRIAELLMVISIAIGPLYILLCMGRMDRIPNIFMYPRLQSPIVWDVLAITTFLLGGLLFLFVSLIKDFALYRDYDLKVAPWKKRIYKVLSLGYHNSPKQRKILDLSMDLMAIIIIPIVIIIASIVSWIFGMTLRPGWNSTIFGPYFVTAAVYSGIGAIVIAMWVYRKIYHLEKYFTDAHFEYLGFMLIAFAAAYGYFTFSEHFTEWYTSEQWTDELNDKLFDLNQFGWWFYFASFGGILLPIIVIGLPWLRSTNSITLMSVVVVFAMWVKRYLIVVPTLETTLLPMQDLRPEYIRYTATWVEWFLLIGGFVFFLLLFTLATKLVTIVPIWDTAEVGKGRKKLRRQVLQRVLRKVQ